MKCKLCPYKKVCRDECSDCSFNTAFNVMTVKIKTLKAENEKIKRKLAKYEELGTVEELDEALYNATL